MSAGGGPVVTDWLLAVSSGVTSSAILYAVRALRKFSKEHDWLMSTTRDNTKAIRELMPVVEEQGKAIEKLLRANNRRG